MLPAQAHAASRIFAIDHDKIEAPIGAQPRQRVRNRLAPAAPHHIAQEK